MTITDFRQVFKKNTFLFNTHLILTDRTYLLNFIDYFRHNNVKPRKIVWNEVQQFCKYWKCEPFTYFKYRIFEKNLGAEELLDYVPAYFFYNVYIPDIYMNKNIYDIGNSKIKQSAYLSSRNIPAPREIATIIKGIPYNNSSERTSFTDVINKMNEFGCQSVFIKPDLGKGGKGIYRLEKRQGRFFMKNQIVDEKLLNSVASNKSFLIQEGMIQREDFNEMHANSVNTVRFVTMNLNNHVEIIASELRMGQNGHYVDNVSSGGLGININVQTGALGSYAVDHYFKNFKIHPGSGFKFEGYKIPGWNAMVNDIISYSRRAPEFPNIAWDTAVTDKGIRILELNINYGFDVLQYRLGGLRRKMGVVPAVQHQS